MTKYKGIIQKIIHKASSSRKLYVFLFCLCLSIFFWLLNALGKESTTEAVFNISYIKQPTSSVVLNELPNQLKIKINGLGFDLMAYMLRLKRPTVNVDLSKLKGGNNKRQKNTLSSTAFLSYVANQLGEHIAIEEIYPDSIHFLFDVKAEKKVKILPTTQLHFKKNFQLYGRLLVKPAVTMVSGPASIVDTLTAVYTEELTLNDLDETITESIGFRQYYTLKKLTFNPEKVIIHIPVEQFKETSIMVNVTPINAPDSIDITVIPNQVELKFLIPLNKMASLANAKFGAKIDYTKINDNFNHKLMVELTEYPAYIQSFTLNPRKVEYILKERK